VFYKSPDLEAKSVTPSHPEKCLVGKNGVLAVSLAARWFPQNQARSEFAGKDFPVPLRNFTYGSSPNDKRAAKGDPREDSQLFHGGLGSEPDSHPPD